MFVVTYVHSTHVCVCRLKKIRDGSRVAISMLSLVLLSELNYQQKNLYITTLFLSDRFSPCCSL